ncbi:anaerobic sulfite reductase subunit AsrB, partial [Candidatus Woesearchaeota archaeon]|nr:anaerobic sulfite reductase subunit AsrB [Candidatus Woesearchaeota archaeon]
KKMNNPYFPQKQKILGIKNETADISTYKINFRSDHLPGQFVEVYVPKIGECPISLCSYSKDHIELAVRNVGNVTNAIHKLKKGDIIYVRGPYGHGYPMNILKKKNLTVIGGGTGAAPLRGVIEFIIKNRKQYKNVDVFLGFRSPDDILFKYDLEKWKKHMNVYLTVDRAESSWKGNAGLVTALLEKMPPKKGSIAITCGPPIMIKFVIELLEKQGFKDSQIFVSFERLMHCGIGKCGHCMIEGNYACRDGPVFRHDFVKNLED